MELDLELNNSTIENEHARNVQLAMNNLPAPSKLCARKPLASLVSEESRQALAALGSLGDIELPMDSSHPRPQNPMEAQPSSASAAVAQLTDADVEMDEATTTQVETNQTTTEKMEVTVPIPVNDSVASALEQVPQTSAAGATVGEASDTVVPAAPQRPARLSPKKAQQAAIVAAKPPLAKITAEEVDCPIVKWPAALLMQKVENFLVNTAQRQLWLGSRRKAAGKELKIECYKPERNHNTVSPVMPTPKERKRPKEFRASDISSVKFDDLELREKCRCWSSSQACSVKIVDREGMKALARRLNMDNFAEAQYESVIDPGLAAMSATILCKDHDLARLQRDYEPRSVTTESQMLTAWNIKALSVQMDMVLALFGMTSKDLNCSNVGEPAEAVKRRILLCGQFVRILMQDCDLLAIVSRSDAPIFLR